MSGRCPRIALLCLGLILWSVSAWADEADAQDEYRDRWIPSLTFDVLLHDQTEGGSLDTPLLDCSEETVGDESSVCPKTLSRTESTTTSIVQYRLGLDLMSPRIDFLSFMFAPRLWLFGGALFNPQQTHPVMKSPSDARFPPNYPQDKVDSYFPPPYPGVGAEIRSRYTDMGWFVGGGTVFELPYRDSMFRIKVGVNYLRERVSINSKLVAVKATLPGVPGVGICTVPEPKPDPLPAPCEVVRTNLGWKEQSYDYLGPIGELEMVLVPGSRVSFSIYGQAQFLWNLDPSAVVMRSDAGNVNSTFTYLPDDFTVRGAIGMRLSWRAGFGF